MNSYSESNKSFKEGRFGVLSNRDFRLLWISSWLRNHGRSMEIVVWGWVVLELTDSPWRVGLIGFLRLVGMPALGLFAGVVAEWANRKMVIVLADVGMAGCSILLFLLVLTERVEFWHVAVLVFMVGTSWAVSYPTRYAIIQDIVGSKRLTSATAWDQASTAGTKMLGPLIGGALLGLTGAKGAAFLIAATYSFGLSLLPMVHVPIRQTKTIREPVHRILRTGFTFMLSSRVFLGTILVTIVVNLCLVPYMQMVPVFARDVLAVGPILMGVLAAGDGMGAFLGSIWLASRPRITSPGRLYIYGPTLAFISILFFSLTDTFALSLPFMISAGVGLSGFATMQAALVLLSAPPDIRGRAMGVLVVAIGASPVGMVITGAIAERWGSPIALFLNCIAGLAMIAIILLLVPAMRQDPTFPVSDEVKE